MAVRHRRAEELVAGVVEAAGALELELELARVARLEVDRAEGAIAEGALHRGRLAVVLDAVGGGHVLGQVRDHEVVPRVALRHVGVPDHLVRVRVRVRARVRVRVRVRLRA